MSYILQTNHLTKRIDGKELVKDVNIHVKKGEIYGFLGPNGAGKTTVMKMITNLWKPTEGTVELFGEVLQNTSYDVFRRMGSIIEFPTFYEHMSGRDNLQLHCEYMGYYSKDSLVEALDMLGLPAGEKVFAGNEAASGNCPRHSVQAGAGVAGRTHKRVRPGGNEANQGFVSDAVNRVWHDISDIQPSSGGNGKHCRYHRHHQPWKADQGNFHAGNPGNEYGLYRAYGGKHTKSCLYTLGQIESA